MLNYRIRPAKDSDFSEITSIYAFNVAHGTGTFALNPPLKSDMLTAFDSIRQKNLPYLVAENNEQILGFAYVAPFRPREGYRYGVEDSIYLAAEATGKGIGKALLKSLIEVSTERGLYMMIAVIGDSENAASIGLHKACGFVETGCLPKSGYKFGRWLDVVFMCRELNPIVATPEGDGWAAT